MTARRRAKTLGSGAVRFRSSHGRQAPSHVPVLPGLNIGRNPFGELIGGPAFGGKYQPLGENGFTRHNGDLHNRHALTTGTWLLYAHDLPYLEMATRSGGSYAQPAFLPGLGAQATVRVAIEVQGALHWLDRFAAIDVFLYPGRIGYACSDPVLGISVHLELDPFIERFGFAVRAEVQGPNAHNVRLVWAVGRVGDGDESIVLSETYAQLSAPGYPYTRVYAGVTAQECELRTGPRSYLDPARSSAPPEPVARIMPWMAPPTSVVVSSGAAEEDSPHCAVISVPLHLGPDAKSSHHFVLVWGYTDYDRDGLAAAYQRIRFRPFPDPDWVEVMKTRYFQHWIGRGLDPEARFFELRASVESAVAENVAFWQDQCRRFSVRTPDRYLDNVINSMSAAAYLHYEYPAFIHGLEYHKYGKINHGYYGFESAGLHQEVAESLKLVSGTQCVKGRQRYFSPALAISTWAEDMDFYFVEQVWYHWRWTGDITFLANMWPAVRRALEHGLAVSDPNCDGIMAGYYEQWNCDGNDSGDRGVLQTAMAWAALRAGAQMAAVLKDVDFMGHGFKAAFQPDPPDYAERYSRLMKHVEEQFARHLWNNDVGAWSSAEPNGIVRPRAHTMEQNYHIWRGLGDPLRNYMGLRFIREEYQHSDISLGATFEYINDFWPVIWSHHYVATGDTLATFLSACAVGDAEQHWTAFKTVSDTAYEFGGPVWHHVGNRTMETDPMYLQAVIAGLFGVQPWLGENLFVIRPAFPAAWDRVECNHRDIRYTYHRSVGRLEMAVHTPVPRRVRLELAVQAPVGAVTLDGRPAVYRVLAGLNQAYVEIELPVSISAVVTVVLAGDAPVIAGDVRRVVGQRAAFVVQGIDGVELHDPQERVRDVRVTLQGDGAAEVSFVPVRPGRCTVFLRLAVGNIAWLRPLDLTVVEPVRAITRYTPGLNRDGPAVASPHIDIDRRIASIQVENNTSNLLTGEARITVARQVLRQELVLPAQQKTELMIDLEPVWTALSPGTVPLRLALGGYEAEADAIAWTIPASVLAGRLHQVDLRPAYNADMATLFSPRTRWRLDYAGGQHGVDWRSPIRSDERGYVNTNSVMSLYDYGVLSEHVLPVATWHAPADLSVDTVAACGIPFKTEAGRILAVCCTEPYDQFPSSTALSLGVPMNLEKLYFLTANLVKPRKSYFPAAELVVHYVDGAPVTHPLVPPHTMPGLLQHFCPRACAIPYGYLTSGNPIPDNRCYLSVTDIVLDAARAVGSIEVRSATTESILGVLGMTLLDAE